MLLAALMPLTTTLFGGVVVVTLSIFVSDFEDNSVLADSTADEGGGIVVLPEASCFRSVFEGFEVVVLGILFILSNLIEHR